MNGSSIPAGLDQLLARLSGLQPAGEGRWRARCPGHEGKSRSLSVRIAGDGRVLLHCFAGCEFSNILGAVGVAARDLFPPGTALGGQHAKAAFAEQSNAREILDAVAHEVAVAVILTSDLAAGRTVDQQRLELCARRLANAAATVRGAGEALRILRRDIDFSRPLPRAAK